MDYFDTYVLINLRAYEAAEANLSTVSQSHAADTPEFEQAAGEAMVAGMNAATPAYHMADQIFTQHKVNPTITYGATDLRGYRDYLDQHRCLYVDGGGRTVPDLSLLGAVVDAYKHFDLNNRTRPVTSASATVVVSTGWGEAPWGEGKWGGTPQVVVRLNSGGIRMLSKILQNVTEMWKTEIATHGL